MGVAVRGIKVFGDCGVWGLQCAGVAECRGCSLLGLHSVGVT